MVPDATCFVLINDKASGSFLKWSFRMTERWVRDRIWVRPIKLNGQEVRRKQRECRVLSILDKHDCKVVMR